MFTWNPLEVVSGIVRETVAGRLKAAFIDRGDLTLKNIERPISAFEVNWDPTDWPVLQVPPAVRWRSVSLRARSVGRQGLRWIWGAVGAPAVGHRRWRQVR